MHKLIIAAALLSACGYQAKDNELVGQVKKVVERTPLICGDYTEADVSLGVLRNGNGSMSREDVELRVNNDADRKLLKHAAETGAPIKANYDIKRIVFCGPDHIITHVELLPDPTAETKP